MKQLIVGHTKISIDDMKKTEHTQKACMNDSHFYPLFNKILVNTAYNENKLNIR